MGLSTQVREKDQNAEEELNNARPWSYQKYTGRRRRMREHCSLGPGPNKRRKGGKGPKGIGARGKEISDESGTGWIWHVGGKRRCRAK